MRYPYSQWRPVLTNPVIRSQSVRAREPSPPVDYPDPGASEDTDENDVRIADYAANDKKSRRKSVQSYSKRTSVTRQYPGCVIA